MEKHNQLTFISRLQLLEHLARDKTINTVHVLNILNILQPNATNYNRSVIDLTIEYVKNLQKLNEGK